ncbi:polysaccharide biosynthesis C-terminal domain-containing protein [Sporomusa sphaeroides]|uniref:oligosaccharide flippase family protein n=1 Tax=Sporomusa sphaeroides TaxID=47679 RepID=UPI002BC4A273|nr:polysaccharide biosynthesis C-terminal domain-containing protein [Sporomusa sphaeroides]HML34176.1 polysaccharide biosynthesis C-terminal domain-containing protein [Sporomusa sphaeroides]
MRYRASILNNFCFKIIKIIIGLIISVIIVRQFGAAGNGYISFFILVIDTLSTNNHLGINDAIIYFYKKKNYDKEELFQTGLSFIIIVSIIISAAIIVSRLLHVFFLDYNLYIILVGIAYLIIKSISIFINSFYIADEKIIELNKYTFISDSIKLSGITIVYLLDYLSFEVYFTIIVINQITLVYMQMINLKIIYKFKYSNKLLLDELKYGIFIFIGSLCIFLNYKVDQFFINIYHGNFELGLYSLAVMFAELLFIIPQSVKTVLNGRLLNIRYIKGDNTTYLSIKITFYISCIIIIISICLFPIIIPIIYGNDFILSIKPAIILLISVLFASIATVLSSYVVSLGENKIQMLFSFNTVVVNIVLNMLLIPPYGIIGAAIASLISYSVYSGQYIWFFLKKEKCSLDKIFILKREDLEKIGILSPKR